jgi:hypothetical protein
MSIAAAPRRPAAPRGHIDATWSVATECRGSAVARVGRRADDLEVLVGDGVTEGGGELVSTAFATLHGDGTLHVRTQAAPPALWVQSAGVWLLPSGSSGPDPRPCATDRLLLLSADALEAEPSGLVALLAMPAQTVLTMPARDVLTLVLPSDGSGAAAVVWRTLTASTDPAGHRA